VGSGADVGSGAVVVVGAGAIVGAGAVVGVDSEDEVAADALPVPERDPRGVEPSFSAAAFWECCLVSRCRTGCGS
jgi:hypothetical protein